MTFYVGNSFYEFSELCNAIDVQKVEQFIKNLVDLKKRNGRLFILGYGGSAGNADHMANDLMKICGIHCVVPTNYTSLMTAVGNDEKFQDYFLKFLEWNNITSNDDIFILSVSGGGTSGSLQSIGLPDAVWWAYSKNRVNKVYGILGKSGRLCNVKVPRVDFLIVPEINSDMVTPYSESMQGVIWHIMANDPRLF